MKDNGGKVLNLIFYLLPFACIITLWVVMAKAVDSEYILPSLSATFSALSSLLKQSEFYSSLFSTLGRSVIAFIFSFALAFVLAVISTLSKSGHKIIAPLVSVMRALPTVAVVLLLLFWTNSKIAPVVVTALVVLPTAYTQLKSAMDGVDKITVDAALVDGADRLGAFLRIELPQIVPSVYSAVGSGLSLNFKLMVAAEVLSATANSLGYLLNTSKVYFEIANMIAIVVVAVVIGLVVELTFTALSEKSGQWK